MYTKMRLILRCFAEVLWQDTPFLDHRYHFLQVGVFSIPVKRNELTDEEKSK